jgi:DNA-binding Lrp family transcriptional regulator
MSDIDKPLMCLLGEDASRSSDSLAREIGVSAVTVRRRIRKLSNEGTLRIVAVVDPQKVGLPVGALLSLEVPQDKLDVKWAPV